MNEVDFSMRSLAKQAKNRLCNDRSKTTFRECVNDFSSLKEEILYDKITEMLQSKAPISNPIGRLIDKSKYEQSDETTRQKMVLDMSKTYIRLKRKFYSDRNHNRG